VISVNGLPFEEYLAREVLGHRRVRRSPRRQHPVGLQERLLRVILVAEWRTQREVAVEAGILSPGTGGKVPHYVSLALRRLEEAGLTMSEERRHPRWGHVTRYWRRVEHQGRPIREALADAVEVEA
jgi:hypothetical protein